MYRTPKPLSREYILVKTLDLVLEFYRQGTPVDKLEFYDVEMKDFNLQQFQIWLTKQIPNENIGNTEMSVEKRFRKGYKGKNYFRH